MPTCGNCQFYKDVEKQQYNDCREASPRVIVASFKAGEGNMANMQVGKIMTVWPRVARDETVCGRFKLRA